MSVAHVACVAHDDCGHTLGGMTRLREGLFLLHSDSCSLGSPWEPEFFSLGSEGTENRLDDWEEVWHCGSVLSGEWLAQKVPAASPPRGRLVTGTTSCRLYRDQCPRPEQLVHQGSSGFRDPEPRACRGQPRFRRSSVPRCLVSAPSQSPFRRVLEAASVQAQGKVLEKIPGSAKRVHLHPDRKVNRKVWAL